MKQHSRVIGISSSGFNRDHDERAVLVFTLVRCPNILESIEYSSVAVDGDDLAERIIEVMKNYSELNIAMTLTGGIAAAGLNLYSPSAVFQGTTVPAVSISRKIPSTYAMAKAIETMSRKKGMDPSNKLQILHELEIKKVTVKDVAYFTASAGIAEKEIEYLLSSCLIVGLVPEPLRIARIIASGIFRGRDSFSVHHKI
ncbi:MAG: endonuclease dU [Thermoplasmataceae archaeon]